MKRQPHPSRAMLDALNQLKFLVVYSPQFVDEEDCCEIERRPPQDEIA
jgi:hypothetical protein